MVNLSRNFYLQNVPNTRIARDVDPNMRNNLILELVFEILGLTDDKFRSHRNDHRNDDEDLHIVVVRVETRPVICSQARRLSNSKGNVADLLNLSYSE